MNDRIRTLGWVLAASALLLLGGCVTPGGYGSPGGYGGYGNGTGGYGQPAPDYPSQYDSQLQGAVDGVDSRYNRIALVVDDPRSGRQQRVDVRYDERTRLFYEGREHPVDGLERGDVIRMEVTRSGQELVARSIQIVRNVRDGGYGGNNSYGQDLRGSIAFIDARSRLIRLEGAGYGSTTQVNYDSRTAVEYQGRSYRPEDLQRGDLVRIQTRQVGNNQWLAERILVERSVGR
ncbi:MAG: DUF5666 domain-containing protein [Pseudoxanthomonas sp.]